MSDDITGTEREAPRRALSVLAFGDTADEIELAALDEARAFFGKDRQLRVVPDYKAMTVLPGLSLAKRANGKKFHATVTVCTVEG